jgi:glycosyltransferase involved in cell wall biosynthesis
MRLLIVSDTYTPDINGVARTLREWATGLVAKGHEVGLVTTSNFSGDDEGVKRQVVLSFPLPGYTSIRIGLASVKWFLQSFEVHRPDLLYVATETPMGLTAILAARKVGIPVISGFHTNFHTYLKNYYLNSFQSSAEALLASFHNHTARTLVPSACTAELLRSMGVVDVGIVGRGVNTQLFRPGARDPGLRQMWGCGDDSPVAIHVGRLAEEKNLALLEKGFAAFLESKPEGRCVVVGDGPAGERLRAEHPNWIFVGMRCGADLARHYASGDVFLFPSTTETFGNVVTESLASGLICVAYDYAAAAQHIRSGENGLLAPLHDEVEFLQKTREAASRWNDSEMRVNARASGEELGWHRIVDLFESHFLDILQQTKSHPDPSTIP